MADSIEAIVYDRLEMDGDLDDDAKLYVMAALDGTLGEAIEGGGEGRTAPRPNVPETPAGAYLRRVSVSGFRGIGPRADLEVVPGPGLTLVVGANGTGKSAEWRQGWLNLHAQDPPEIQAVFAVDGETGDAVVSRRWQSADATSIEEHALEGLESLEWESALDTHRPFLSYDQLSDIVDAPPRSGSTPWPLGWASSDSARLVMCCAGNSYMKGGRIEPRVSSVTSYWPDWRRWTMNARTRYVRHWRTSRGD